MSALRPIPIVMFGLLKEIGGPVSEALKPEYEVIHFFNSLPLGKTDLPRLLRSETPSQPTAAGVGTGNYAHPPQAILFGRAFSNEEVDELRAACVPSDNAEGGVTKEGVPWLRAGIEKAEIRKIMTGETPRPEVEQYAPMVAQRAKDVLEKVKGEGRWGLDGVYIW